MTTLAWPDLPKWLMWLAWFLWFALLFLIGWAIGGLFK